MGGLLIDFVFLSIKDCKCDVNGSTGCHTSGTCICKENYVGRKCQQCKLNLIFKWLLIFLFYALNLINGFYAGSVFKEILCFLNMCLVLSVWKVFIFPWIFNVPDLYAFILHELRTKKNLVYYFLALKVEKAQVDCNGGMTTLDMHDFCHKSQFRDSEINVTHDALLFECSGIMKFVSPYQKIA